MLEDKAFDAQLDHRNIDIDQKAEPKAGQLQKCQHLRIEDWRQCVDRLQLDLTPVSPSPFVPFVFLVVNLRAH